jgi:hypothetical protein
LVVGWNYRAGRSRTSRVVHFAGRQLWNKFLQDVECEHPPCCRCRRVPHWALPWYQSGMFVVIFSFVDDYEHGKSMIVKSRLFPGEVKHSLLACTSLTSGLEDS